ncbi:MAG: helix-turn-helix transcriptional regulator [Corynebacterium sp.]|nr:helix-turn-helix transcriptional regulator [Corynebacterium sp.]
MSTGRPLRADAQKNYDSLIKVARNHLSQQGVSTSLDAIAKEAGVGAGTLYRHFPDRDHLIFAALNTQGEELRETAATIRKSAKVEDQLESWLSEVEKYFSSYHGLPDSLAKALDKGTNTPLAITCHEIIEVTEAFLTEAQQLNIARADVTAQNLFEATLMIAWLSARVPDQGNGLNAVRNLCRYGYRV